jgi:DNA-binding response OmpR family regulator
VIVSSGAPFFGFAVPGSENAAGCLISILTAQAPDGNSKNCKKRARFFYKTFALLPKTPAIELMHTQHLTGMARMKPPKPRILVVEDDGPLRQGLMDVLVFNGYEVEGEDNGERGLAAGLERNFDLILLDVMLPGLDGFAVCREIRRRKPQQGIILITAKGAENDIVAGFKAGADDYVPKPFSLRELMVRVEAVLRRAGKSAAPVDLVIDEVRFDGRNLVAEGPGGRVELTRREMDIIAYLHRHAERIVSKKELLTDVWHYADAGIETRTVDIHIMKLRKKLSGLAGNAPLIATVRGEGYKLRT